MAAAVGTLSLLLLGCVALTPADGCDKFAAIDQRFEVPLGSDLQNNRLWWKHNSKTIYDSNKKDNQRSVTAKSDLILSKVTKNDEGSYTADITHPTTGQPVNKFTIKLCVLERVSKPTVTIKCDSKKQKVEFTCNVPQVQDFNYTWSEGNQPIINQKAKILVRKSDQLGSNSFSCSVSNQVSSQTSDPVKQDCIRPTSSESPGVGDENTLFGLDFWLMVGILAGGGGLVLVLFVATIVCCSVNRKKQRLQVKDEQELRLQLSTSNQQQYHNHHTHGHPPQHHHGPTPTQGRHAADAGHTGPRPQRSRQNRPRPPDPITRQPLPGPGRQPQTQKQTIVGDEEAPPPLPQPRKKGPRTPRGPNE